MIFMSGCRVYLSRGSLQSSAQVSVPLLHMEKTATRCRQRTHTRRKTVYAQYLQIHEDEHKSALL